MAISLQGLCRWAAQIAKVMCVHHYLPGFTWIALQCWLCLKQNTKCDCSLNWAVWEGFRARGWLWRWDGHGDPPLHRINLPPEQSVGSRLFPEELFCKECVGWGSWVQLNAERAGEKKQLRAKAGMGKPRADKYEGRNGRKRVQELEMKMGTSIDFCLQTQSVTRAGQDFFLKQSSVLTLEKIKWRHEQRPATSSSSHSI